MENWWEDAVFYHIYPLGYLDAPANNSEQEETEHRILRILEHTDEIKRLGCNTIYFGPVFESLSHGYDTSDFGRIDRRLGDGDSFRSVVDSLHRAGIRVVLDGVFNHAGREFPPFLDLMEKGPASEYAHWFRDVDFSRDNSYGDGFSYRGWEGNDELVSLNHKCGDLRDYLFHRVTWMIEELGIDGLRLDVAYLLDGDFLDALSSHCTGLKKNFWLMGEMIHGDYRQLIQPGRLHSATNYECYKGLYSSHNDRNYFEIAWSLNRLFGSEGIYKDLLLYNFADNHDVDRLSSILKEKKHLPLVYVLLFTMPGIPSVYYGSEWGVTGEKTAGDRYLRPPIDAIDRSDASLTGHIANLSLLRRLHSPLRLGDYHQIHVSHEQLLFQRRYKDHRVTVALNASETPADLSRFAEGFFLGPYDWKLEAE